MTDLVQALEQSAPGPQKTVRDLLARMEPELTKLLPQQVTAERFTRTVLTELRRTPKLYDCDPASLLGAMMLAAQLGLEPGPLGHVYLVPFKRECSFILGYKGMVALAYRAGMLKDIAARTVRVGDDFDYRYGTRPFLDHTPASAPGEPVAYYAVARTTTGGAPFVVLTPDEIEATRKRSASAKSDLSPWTTDYDAMARKTAIRRLFPSLPSLPDAWALDVDEQPAPPVADVGDTLALEGGDDGSAE